MVYIAAKVYRAFVDAAMRARLGVVVSFPSAWRGLRRDCERQSGS